MRRYAPMKVSLGTRWPTEVRAHVYGHQPRCVGPEAGMPGPCEGGDELDHVRASGGVGMKSLSIAVNGARLCGAHHRLKTREGRTWRPRLLSVIADRHGRCSDCRRESIERYGMPLGEEVA